MAPSAFVRFNIIFAVSVVGFLLLGGSGLWLLHRAGRLPPPPLTATNCIDEKFRFLRNHGPEAPRLIAVGSSVTWRNLDFSVLSEDDQAAQRPVNAAPCYLKMNETAFLTRFYLDNMPTVETVISVFAMRDFEACEGEGTFFDTTDARRYLFGGWPGWPLYFQNFRPLLFLQDVLHIRDMRSGADSQRSLTMDPWGSGPLRTTPPSVRDDVTTDQRCFEFLDRMRRDMEARNVRWIVVLMPPMPAWLATYDKGGERDRAWRETVTHRLADTEVLLLDGREGPPVRDRNFSDPAHFHQSMVPAFTRWIFSEVRQLIEQSS